MTHALRIGVSWPAVWAAIRVIRQVGASVGFGLLLVSVAAGFEELRLRRERWREERRDSRCR